MDDPLVKLAIFQALGRGVGGGVRGFGRLFDRATFGRRTMKGFYADAERARLKALGLEHKFKGVSKLPRGNPKDPGSWKTIDRGEHDRLLKSKQYAPGDVTVDTLGTGEKVHRVRKLQYSPRSVAGVVQRHPGKIIGGGIMAAMLWDPVTQTYRKSTDTMSGVGPQDGYYLPSQ